MKIFKLVLTVVVSVAMVATFSPEFLIQCDRKAEIYNHITNFPSDKGIWKFCLLTCYNPLYKHGNIKAYRLFKVKYNDNVYIKNVCQIWSDTVVIDNIG